MKLPDIERLIDESTPIGVQCFIFQCPSQISEHGKQFIEKYLWIIPKVGQCQEIRATGYPDERIGNFLYLAYSPKGWQHMNQTVVEVDWKGELENVTLTIEVFGNNGFHIELSSPDLIRTGFCCKNRFELSNFVDLKFVGFPALNFGHYWNVKDFIAIVLQFKGHMSINWSPESLLAKNANLDFGGACSSKSSKCLDLKPDVTPEIVSIPLTEYSFMYKTTADVEPPANFSTYPNIGIPIKIMEKLYDEKLFADIEIIVKTIDGQEETKLLAHKAVLSAGSSVFKEIFANERTQNIPTIIEILGFESEVVEELLHYFYKGEILNFGLHAAELLKVGLEYKIPSLVELSQQFITERNNIGSWKWSTLLQLLHAYGSKVSILEEALKAHFKRNEESLRKLDDFKMAINLYPETLVKLWT